VSRRKEYIIKNKIPTNYSTIFLLPMLGYKPRYFHENEFISCYIHEDLQKKIVLCFENSSREEFKNIIWTMQTHEDFLSVDYEDDEKEVVVVFKVPRDKEVDYNLFKIGRYTKFSNEYKEILLNYSGRKTGAGKCIMMIDSLNPDYLAKKYRADKMGVSINDLTNGEVMSVPDMSREEYIKTDDLINKKEGISAGEQ